MTVDTGGRRALVWTTPLPSASTMSQVPSATLVMMPTWFVRLAVPAAMILDTMALCVPNPTAK